MIPIHALKQLEDALAESYGWGNNPFVREKITLAVTSKADRLGIAPEEYCRIAASSQSELLALVEETASSESCFFREPEQFELLRRRIIPQLLNSLPGNEKLKIWSSVCATGEEAYSLAIVFDQIKRASTDHAGRQVEIFATDVRNRSLLEASRARYGKNSVGTLDADLLDRYFEPSFLNSDSGDEPRYAVLGDIRKNVTFRRVNLLDKLFWKGVSGRFDLIVCSNQLTFMHAAAARQMVINLANSLKPDGYLMVGPGEKSLVNASSMVQLVEAPAFFRRIA
ncbi:MAG: hypothetical protein IPO77_02125 [Acidobacteria bacterium]|nr:hypothetical protein [Acidobacteriota bacterium]